MDNYQDLILLIIIGIPILVIFVVYIIARLKLKFERSERKKDDSIYVRQNNNRYSSLDEDNKSVKIGRDLVQKLIDKDLSDYILDSFKYKTPLNNMDLFNDNVIENKIGAMVYECLAYLKLFPSVKIHLHFGKDEMREKYGMDNAAGLFRGSSANGEISILIESNYTADNIRAIVCHECTHYFMRANNLEDKDRDLNEIHTDIFANLIGFSDYMNAGYKPTTTERIVGNQRYTRTHSIGYISSNDCEQIGLLRKKEQLRVMEIQEEKDKSKTKEMIGKLDDSLHDLKILNSRFKTIDFKSIHVKSPAAILLVQQTLKNYEDLDIDKVVEKYSDYLKEGNPDSKISNAIEYLSEKKKELQVLLDDISKLL